MPKQGEAVICIKKFVPSDLKLKPYEVGQVYYIIDTIVWGKTIPVFTMNTDYIIGEINEKRQWRHDQVFNKERFWEHFDTIPNIRRKKLIKISQSL